MNSLHSHLQRRSLVLWLGLAAISMLVGPACDDDEGSEGGSVVPVGECQSGLRWTQGNEESPLMHPGGDCIGCHAAEDEGPTFAVAGTVFESLDEPTDCFGLGGVTVELTDAAGQVVTMTTNDAGNFFVKSKNVSLKMPYTARVSSGGTERTMATPQHTGNCSSCHSAGGAAGAAGRIILGP